jgi:4-hydroxy-3-polyprenylbenzoate decarboxylase
MGIDATNKWPAETSRHWGRELTMDAAVTERVEGLMRELKL